MKKMIVLMMAAVISIGMFAGCGKKNDTSADTDTKKDNNVKTDKEDGFTFSDIADQDFTFCSGAGGWSTDMTVDEEGNFKGRYHDSDMGDIDAEAPGGICYVANFTGTFDKLKKVDEYTYSTTIADISYEQKLDTEEVKDGVRYKYVQALGFEDAEEIMFYLPGAAVKELPEGFVLWMNYAQMDTSDDAKLSVYGIYNVEGECGFLSQPDTDATSDKSIDEELEEISSQADALENNLQTQDMTQTEMTGTTAQIYKLWDDELNSIWSRVSDKLSGDKKDTLLAEQRQWIKDKDKKVKEAGAEYEGGTMQPMIENDKAAELTKERVYKLAEYLK